MQAIARVTRPHISLDTGWADLTSLEGCSLRLREGPAAKDEPELKVAPFPALAGLPVGVYGWGERGGMGDEGVMDSAKDEGVAGGDSERTSESPALAGEVKPLHTKNN